MRRKIRKDKERLIILKKKLYKRWNVFFCPEISKLRLPSFIFLVYQDGNQERAVYITYLYFLFSAFCVCIYLNNDLRSCLVLVILLQIFTFVMFRRNFPSCTFSKPVYFSYGKKWGVSIFRVLTVTEFSLNFYRLRKILLRLIFILQIVKIFWSCHAKLFSIELVLNLKVSWLYTYE